MNLNESQKIQLAGWVEQGMTLSEIQDKLGSEFGLRLTYMEVRFLIDDLRLKPKDKEPTKSSGAELNTLGKTSATPPSTPDDEILPGKREANGGGVSVSVDQVTRAGALVSGKVTFSDGKAAEWQLDQFGRLGLVSKEPGYKPSQTDLLEFQAELQDQLAKLGL